MKIIFFKWKNDLFIEKLNNSIRTDLIEEKEINTKEKDLNEGKENLEWY